LLINNIEDNLISQNATDKNIGSIFTYPDAENKLLTIGENAAPVDALILQSA
jgi:hypothetical protein